MTSTAAEPPAEPTASLAFFALAASSLPATAGRFFSRKYCIEAQTFFKLRVFGTDELKLCFFKLCVCGAGVRDTALFNPSRFNP